jgi:transposase-like protein
VHKLRNLIAHAPKKLAEEIAADFSDMIYATTAKEVVTRRKAFIRKWRLKCRAVADSLEEAGDKLFTFNRLPVAQWKSVRTTNAIERLHEEFKRRIKTQTVCRQLKQRQCCSGAYLLPGRSRCARSMVGRRWRNGQPSSLTSPLNPLISTRRRSPSVNFHHIRDGTFGRTLCYCAGFSY